MFTQDTPIVISSILDGLRMREAYFNAKRTRAGPRAWSDFLDKVAGLFLWSDGGLIAKDRSLRVLCMQVLAVCEAALASMFSKVSLCVCCLLFRDATVYDSIGMCGVVP